jgi:hypothetical protein
MMNVASHAVATPTNNAPRNHAWPVIGSCAVRRSNAHAPSTDTTNWNQIMTAIYLTEAARG